MHKNFNNATGLVDEFVYLNGKFQLIVTIGNSSQMAN